MTETVAVDREGNSEDRHEVVDHSVTEKSNSPDIHATETSRTNESKYSPLPDNRSSSITSDDKIAHTVDADFVRTTSVNEVLSTVASSHPFPEESSSKMIPRSTQNEIPSVTYASEHKVTSDEAHLTTHITEPETLSTEQSSLRETSSAPITTGEPTKPQTTQQFTTAMTSSRPIETTTTRSPDMTSSVGSSKGSTRRVTTAVADVTITHKRRTTGVRTSSITSVNSSTYSSTKDSYPYLTSVNVDGDFNSTVGSITPVPQQLPLTYIIIGAASLAVIFIVLMCIVVVCICRKRQRKNSGLDEFEYSFDLRARSRRTSNGPARVSYSFTQRSYSHNSFSDIPGAHSGLGNASTLNVPEESNMKKAHSNSDNLLTRYNLEPNMYISDEPDSPEANGLTSPPITGNIRSSSDSKYDRNESVMYSTFKRAPKGVELAEGFQGELLV